VKIKSLAGLTFGQVKTYCGQEHIQKRREAPADIDNYDIKMCLNPLKTFNYIQLRLAEVHHINQILKNEIYWFVHIH